MPLSGGRTGTQDTRGEAAAWQAWPRTGEEEQKLETGSPGTSEDVEVLKRKPLFSMVLDVSGET